jgi:anti-anti-sigma factor
MEVRAERLGSTMILDLDGPLTVDAETRPLHELVRGFASRHTGRVVLDLGHVAKIDSCGVGELVTLYNEVCPSGVALSLVNLEKHQRRLLEVSGLARVLHVCDSRQEALTWGGAAREM